LKTHKAKKLWLYLLSINCFKFIKWDIKDDDVMIIMKKGTKKIACWLACNCFPHVIAEHWYQLSGIELHCESSCWCNERVVAVGQSNDERWLLMQMTSIRDNKQSNITANNTNCGGIVADNEHNTTYNWETTIADDVADETTSKQTKMEVMRLLGEHKQLE
jgi:hypothetical protein